jgi:hypothetical protein
VLSVCAEQAFKLDALLLWLQQANIVKLMSERIHSSPWRIAVHDSQSSQGDGGASPCGSQEQTGCAKQQQRQG